MFYSCTSIINFSVALFIVCVCMCVCVCVCVCSLDKFVCGFNQTPEHTCGSTPFSIIGEVLLRVGSPFMNL